MSRVTSKLRDGASRRDRNPAGQALTEFALVVPVMMVLLLLAVDFGRLFFTYIEVNNAAREATYYASAHAGDAVYTEWVYEAEVATAALREANVQGQGGEGAMTVTGPTCFDPATSSAIDCRAAASWAGGIGNQVTVTVDRPFTFLTPLIGGVFGGDLTLTASATAPVLNPLDATVTAGSEPTPAPTPTPTPAPTATPTPAPTPTPGPGATPTPTPSPTPTPTPTPTPMCTVPDFYHTYWNDPNALETWQIEAGFTGVLTDSTNGKKIQTQTLTAGSSVPCYSNMTVSNN